jgi:hypothetical protein
VIDIVRIKVVSDDRPGLVVGKGDRALAGACARARSIERRDGPVSSAHVAVIRRVCVDVSSWDRPRRVDGTAHRALHCAFARARRIERRDSAVSSAHEAVKYGVRVNVISSNRTCRVEAIDCCGKGALAEGPFVPAPGASNVVMPPSGARTKP